MPLGRRYYDLLCYIMCSVFPTLALQIPRLHNVVSQATERQQCLRSGTSDGRQPRRRAQPSTEHPCQGKGFNRWVRAGHTFSDVMHSIGQREGVFIAPLRAQTRRRAQSVPTSASQCPSPISLLASRDDPRQDGMGEPY